MVAGRNDYYGITNNSDNAASYDSGDLVTSVIGGLNTESNPMDMPLGDTPDMLNTEISPAGTLTKRPGTIIRNDLYDKTSAASKGNGLIDISIANGHTIIVGKLGRNLFCMPIPKHEKIGRSNLTYPSLSISDVWTADATLKPCLSAIPSAIPRVLIATGLNTMVECILYTKTVTVSAPTTSVVIVDKPFAEIPTMLLLDAGRSNAASVENILFIPNYIEDEEDWIVYRASTKSTSSNTVTFSGGFRSIASSSGSYGNIPAGTYTVLRFGWVMWTESIMVDESQTTQPIMLAPDSYSILIPEELGRNAVEDRRLNWDATYKYSPFSLSAKSDDTPYFFTPVTDFANLATGAAERIFAVSDNQTITGTPVAESRLFPVGDTYVIPRDLSSSPTNTYYINRHYRNWLGNNLGLLDARDVRCTFNPYTSEEVNLALLTSYWKWLAPIPSPKFPNPTNWSTTKSYTASVDALWFTAAEVNTTDFSYFAFTGSYPLGLPSGYGSLTNYTSFVSSSYIGTENVTDDAGTGGTGYTDHGKVRFRDASKVPIGGLYEFSTFGGASDRDFGRVVSYFQNRIVLAGFTKYPNLVAFSNSGFDYEWDIGGNLLAANRNFQTWYSDPNLAYNPIQIQLDTESGEFITALLPLEGFLLVFTSKSIHLISGEADAGGFITPTGYLVSKLFDVGTFNQNTVANTESGVMFLSRYGLYILVPSEDMSGRFKLVPLQSKVQRIFNDMSLDKGSNHWITVDEYQRVYIGLCTQGSYVATRLLVFDLRLQAWTEYGAANGYWFSTMGFTSPDGRVFLDYILCSNLTLGTAGSTHLLVEFSKYAELDFMISTTGSTSYSSTSPMPTLTAALPYSVDQQFYNFDLKTVNSTSVLRTIDIDDVVDSAYIIDSGQYEARPIDPRTSLYPVYADVDHVWMDWNSGITGINAASKVLLGTGFPVWFKSSVVTRAFSGRGKHDNKSKRYSHCILHFRNSDNTQYIYSDLNTGAGQAASTIVDKYKTVYDANLSLIFNGSRSSTQYLVYRNTTNVDTHGLLTLPKIRRDLTSRIVLPFLGISNSAQICVFCYGYHKFELIGFQLITRSVGDSRRSWQDLY